jgi:hypothetical protein
MEVGFLLETNEVSRKRNYCLIHVGRRELVRDRRGKPKRLVIPENVWTFH